MEVWIRPNRRAIACGVVVFGVLGVAGAVVWWLSATHWSTLTGQILGALTCAISLFALVGLIWQLRTPRVGYADGRVYFFMRMGAPIVVPLDAVEIFLFGKTGSHVGPAGQPTEVRSIIARIRDRAKEYQNRNVSPALGTWRDGYVMIRGTWCEPVSPDLLKRINRRLHELTRASDG